MHQQQTAFENIDGKGEIACNEQFLLFTKCFLLIHIIVSSFLRGFDIYLYYLLNWKSLKLAYEVKGFTSIKPNSSFLFFFEGVSRNSSAATTTSYVLFSALASCISVSPILWYTAISWRSGDEGISSIILVTASVA